MTKTFRDMVIEQMADYEWPSRKEETTEYLNGLTDLELFYALEDFLNERIRNAMIVD